MEEPNERPIDTDHEEQGDGSTNDTSVLPDDCICNILSLTSPRDACRWAVVSSDFELLADSKSVWGGFLPSDIHQILSSSVSPSDLSIPRRMKELVLHLFDNPLLIDDGTKTIALEKRSGKMCLMIGAKGLSIVDNPNWNWSTLPESRFSDVAELLNMYRLKIRGETKTRLLSPNTTYGAYLVFKLTENAQGLDFRPAIVSVKLISGVDEQEVVKSIYLDPAWRQKNQQQQRRLQQQLQQQRRLQQRLQMEMRQRLQQQMEMRRQRLQVLELKQEQKLQHVELQVLKMQEQKLQLQLQQLQERLWQRKGEVSENRRDGWMELEIGKFFNRRGEDRVVMSLTENSSNAKSGLIIEGIELRPTEIT